MSDPLLPSSYPERDDAGNAKPIAASSAATTREPENAGPAAAIPTPPPPRSHSVTRVMLAGVLALAIGAAAVAWLDARRTQQLLRTQVAQRLADVDAATQVASKAQSQMSTELRDAQAKITLLETRLAESQAQQASLDALYRDLAPSRDEIALTEIEQVLLLASQQLQLAANVPSALAALQLADAKLQRLDRPQFLPLRRALSRDIDRLKAVPYVDIDGMSLKLDQAHAQVDALALAMDERVAPPAKDKAATPPPAESSWERFLRDVWADIRQLVRLEVSDRPAAPLLAPSQTYFLRENLRLRLLSARIALLNRNDASFKADIAAADKWLRQYFDTRSKSVQALQASLKQLAVAPMAGEMPDLVGSLEALRVLRLAQERAPGRSIERSAGTPARATR
jgi:uroporphyrin-3 C-methyltransferase